MVEDTEFWERMPAKRKETFRHLPLEQEGAEGVINESVITRAHDRALPLRLRMFSKGNFSKKGFSSGADAKEPASDWEAPKSLLAVQEALCNFGDVYRCLWPQDNTPRRLSRVLVHFEYGARLGGSEKERSKLLENFCDKVMRETAAGRCGRRPRSPSGRLRSGGETVLRRVVCGKVRSRGRRTTGGMREESQGERARGRERAAVAMALGGPAAAKIAR